MRGSGVGVDEAVDERFDQRREFAEWQRVGQCQQVRHESTDRQMEKHDGRCRAGQTCSFVERHVGIERRPEHGGKWIDEFGSSCRLDAKLEQRQLQVRLRSEPFDEVDHQGDELVATRLDRGLLGEVLVGRSQPLDRPGRRAFDQCCAIAEDVRCRPGWKSGGFVDRSVGQAPQSVGGEHVEGGIGDLVATTHRLQVTTSVVSLDAGTTSVVSWLNSDRSDMFERCVTSLHVADIASARDRYVDLLGFRADLDLGWFVSLRHDAQPDLEIALTSADHESLPPHARRPASGLALAFVVDDVDDFHQRLIEADITVHRPPTDHPWGQRQVLATLHDDVMLDLVQVVDPDPEWMAANGLE